MNHGLGSILRTSGLRLVLVFMFVSSFAQATLADCPACKGEQPDWTQSAIAFMEGKPVKDAPVGLSGPQQARLLNAEIDARKKASQASNPAGNAAANPANNSTALFELELHELSAKPNPVNLNHEVQINAAFDNTGNTSNSPASGSPSKIIDLTNLAVYADILGPDGSDAGRVDLKMSPENGFSGIWNGNAKPGIYNATIEVSGPDGSKTFKDALQIIVLGGS
ncbi:MAG: hypothetical protein PHQ34_06635 [Methanothrix sp.]|nr:hypothetical protein [Methanothrix sp.]